MSQIQLQTVKCKSCNTEDLSKFKEHSKSLTGYYYYCEECKDNEKQEKLKLKQLKRKEKDQKEQLLKQKEQHYINVLNKDIIDCSEIELSIKQTYFLQQIFLKSVGN